jgi:predicted lipid-binding transport protein (Tim44 family)
MKIAPLFIAAVLALGLAVVDDAFAAKRFGGGGNLGKQRAVPANSPSTSPSAAPAATPASPAAAPAAAGAAAAAAKPSFMSRWGGLLAGLGIGALLASMFGAGMGPIVGMLLAALVVGGLVFFLYRMFASRGAPAPAMQPAAGSTLDAGARPAFSGIGSAIPGTPAEPSAPPVPSDAPLASAAALQPDFDVPNFLRQAKSSFIRLQAANDTKDLDDIRDFTTPEVYGEIALQLQERGDAPSRTEVVSVDARLADLARENGYDVASVRFTGLIREDDARNPEPFDEIWHVRKKTGDRNPAWLISGIQQVPDTVPA